MIGLMTSSAVDETTLPTAAPIITPIASASAFCLSKNALNSLIMFPPSLFPNRFPVESPLVSRRPDCDRSGGRASPDAPRKSPANPPRYTLPAPSGSRPEPTPLPAADAAARPYWRASRRPRRAPARSASGGNREFSPSDPGRTRRSPGSLRPRESESASPHWPRRRRSDPGLLERTMRSEREPLPSLARHLRERVAQKHGAFLVSVDHFRALGGRVLHRASLADSRRV